MTILDRIVAHKKLEVERRRGNLPLEKLKDLPGYHRATRSLTEALTNSDHFGIIAEFKRKSPSQADINLGADPRSVASGYTKAGAAAMSCLTDAHFFGAHPNDIDLVRATTQIPIIRKDFTVDAYQLHEARAMGADAILLIATCVPAQQLDELAHEANELGLQVLCEIHDREELKRLSTRVDVVGVNNRNLNDFSVSISTSLELAELLPPGLVKISESGIEDPQSVVKLKRAGFRGFLIGTYFMRQADPGQACMNFIQRCHEIEDLYQDAIA